VDPDKGNRVDGSSPKYYVVISIILLFAFVLFGALLIASNCNPVSAWLINYFGAKKAFLIQLYFWGGAGATIATSVYLARDKERNELEAAKEKPDPKELMYPNLADTLLYVQRILSSGFLALFGACLLFAGLGYFDVSVSVMTSKHKVFFIVFSFLIGLFENRFLSSLESLSKKMFKKRQ
jgi:hypothetical protein